MLDEAVLNCKAEKLAEHLADSVIALMKWENNLGGMRTHAEIIADLKETIREMWNGTVSTHESVSGEE